MKIPNDFVDKYMKLSAGEERIPAVFDLMKQSYKMGFEDGADDVRETKLL